MNKTLKVIFVAAVVVAWFAWEFALVCGRMVCGQSLAEQARTTGGGEEDEA